MGKRFGNTKMTIVKQTIKDIVEPHIWMEISILSTESLRMHVMIDGAVAF